jgi:hypothetical protein
MPTQVPLLNRGAIPLQQSGTMVARTAQLTSGDTGMGRALQGIGAQLEDMAIKEQEADDARLMIDFEGEMRKAVDEQSVFQQQVQEQSEWLPAWQKRSTDLQKRLDGLKVSDKTRLNLTQSFGQFADRHTLNIRGQAFEQSQTRAKMTGQVRLQQAKTPEEVDQVISLMKNSNVGLPEQWDMEREPALNRIKDDQWNAYTLERARLADPQTRTPDSISQLELILENSKDSMETERYQLERSNLDDMKDEVFVYAEIQKNPERVAEMMDNPDFAPRLNAPQQRERIKNQALARIEKMQMEEQRTVMNGILSGSIQNMKQAETLMPRSDAIAKAKIQGVFDKKPPNQYEASILKRALEKAVDEFDPTNDPDDSKTFQIVDTINRLNLYDEKLTSTLRERFYKKQQDRKPPSPIESEIANHKKFLDYVYEPKLKALMDDKTGEVPVEKQEEFRSMLSVRDQLATDFERMVESGEIKTREQARNASVRMLAEPYANQVMDYYRYAPSSEGKSGQIELTPEEVQQIEKQRLKK